jgi:hypothetical protein
MGLHTGTVRNLNRAPYRAQVEVRLIQMGADNRLSPAEEAKLLRVQRFLPAPDCAREIVAARDAAGV